MFDAHCHLDFDAYAQDREAVIQDALAVGVTAIHVPGVAPAQWREAAPLSSDIIGCGVGIHPWWLERLPRTAIDAGLETMARVAAELGAEAVGECGLDKPLAKRGGPSLDEQADVLVSHLIVACEAALPVVLHVVGAHGLALEVLEAHPLPRGAMLHSCSAPADLVPRYAALGMYFSFGAVVTRPTAKRPRAAVAVVPRDRLLLESDGPDQAPVGSQRSVPADLPNTAASVAELLGSTPEAIGALTAVNARRFFGRA